MEHCVKLEMEVYVLQRTQIWVISRCCSVDLRKEIYKDFFTHVHSRCSVY